jgi:hypothetical protein
MHKADFSISGWATASGISLDVDGIRGEGGPEFPHLIVPLEFTLRPSEDRGKIRAFSLLWLQCHLYVNDVRIGIGFSGPIAEYSWPPLSACSVGIEVPLDPYRLEKIEERRRDNVNCRLAGSGLVAEHPPVPKAGPNEQQEYRKDVANFTRGTFYINFTVPRSHWADKILPSLGYGKVELIEIPIPEKIIPDIFKNALDQLIQGRNYFLQGDYDKAVEHCRNALEPLRNKDLLASIKALLTDSKYEWVTEVGEATFDWIDKIYKKTRDITNIPHHPPLIGYFGRFEANAILMVTTALLSYTGKLLKQK